MFWVLLKGNRTRKRSDNTIFETKALRHKIFAAKCAKDQGNLDIDFNEPQSQYPVQSFSRTQSGKASLFFLTLILRDFVSSHTECCLLKTNHLAILHLNRPIRACSKLRVVRYNKHGLSKVLGQFPKFIVDDIRVFLVQISGRFIAHNQ